MKGKLATFCKNLADAVFPENYSCDICGKETFGANLCAECLKTVTFNDKATCPVCGRKTITEELCLECKANAPLFKKAASAIVYEGGGTVLIAKFKNGNGYLKEYFSELIAVKVSTFPECDCIVYVPMTKKAVLKRGYNQAKLLADALSKRTGVPVAKDAVVKVKDTPEQKSLSRKERLKNLEGCFKVAKRAEIKNKNVLLVDDVLTTGSTAETICRKLLGAGAKNVFLATAASVEYKPAAASVE